jgi:FMN phosphatase YigB (HAD superfamily)
MDTYIDQIVSSYDIKALKSTKAAYEECLKLLEVPASQTLFVGHQQYEMDGAKQADIISVP